MDNLETVATLRTKVTERRQITKKTQQHGGESQVT